MTLRHFLSERGYRPLTKREISKLGYKIAALYREEIRPQIPEKVAEIYDKSEILVMDYPESFLPKIASILEGYLRGILDEDGNPKPRKRKRILPQEPVYKYRQKKHSI